MPGPRRAAARQAMENSSAAKYTRIARRKAKEAEGKEPPPRPIGNMQVCWCGKPSGHRYKGAKAGAPHPPPERAPSPPALGHQCVYEEDHGFMGSGQFTVKSCILCGKKPPQEGT